MKSRIPLCLLLIVAFLFLSQDQTIAQSMPTVTIPTEGNSWVVGDPNASREVVTKGGITNWNNPDQRIRTYFYVNNTGALDIWIRLKVATGNSKVKLTFNGQPLVWTINNRDHRDIFLGKVRISRKGYHYLELQGIEKQGNTFAEVPTILIGNVAAKNVQYLKDDFYFGRRGPSVHLWYDRLPTRENIKWFYNEVIVPKGQDVIGSYFMANGFSGGYFGIQVNSATERKILFSVWSPYKTDDPNSIPDAYKVKLLKKGNNINAQKFGGEGSGGQSFKVFNWKADTKYRFLLKGEPAGNNFTDFTAYFFAPELGKWELIASFRRPNTNTYLTGLYSFLENFRPEYGATNRKVWFTNQWVGDIKGNWYELTEAKLTADTTARKGARLDYIGGSNETYFYLQNCGFFNGNTNLDIYFKRKPTGNMPRINLNALP